MFITADSIVPEWNNPQSMNRYSYCLNNPLIYIDPNGHWPRFITNGAQIVNRVEETTADTLLNTYYAIIDVSWTPLFITSDVIGATDTFLYEKFDISPNDQVAIFMSFHLASGQTFRAMRGAKSIIDEYRYLNILRRADKLNKLRASKGTTVLGENMMERVIPYAEKTGSRTLPFGTSADKWAKMTPRQRYKLNDGTLRARIGEGDSFKDIGLDVYRDPALRKQFDLNGSELLRLNERGIPYEVVPQNQVLDVIGRP